MSRLTKIIAGTAVVALGLAGCTSTDNPSADNSLGTITAGSITICTDAPFMPFEYADTSAPSGYAGFDIDIMQAIADKLGQKLVVMDADFDTIQSGAPMAAGNCDLGASAITITDERETNLDFADPYYDSLQSLLVAKSSGITSLKDMAGKNIGIQAGTTGQIYAEANAPSSASLVSFPSDGEMWPALQAGQVDALLEDYPVNMQHAQSDSSYIVVEKYQTDEKYGFAFAKGKNPDLLKAINDALQELRDNGTYDTLYNKYFS